MLVHGIEGDEGVNEDDEDDCEGEVDGVGPKGVIEDVLEFGLELVKEFSEGSKDEDEE